MTETHKTAKNGKAKATNKTPSVDPVYDLPLIGSFVKEADSLRTRLQGTKITRREAELLRIEARGLRHLANYLETRAIQLERLLKEQEGEKPRVTRIQIEK